MELLKEDLEKVERYVDFVEREENRKFMTIHPAVCGYDVVFFHMRDIRHKKYWTSRLPPGKKVPAIRPLCYPNIHTLCCRQNNGLLLVKNPTENHSRLDIADLGNEVETINLQRYYLRFVNFHNFVDTYSFLNIEILGKKPSNFVERNFDIRTENRTTTELLFEFIEKAPEEFFPEFQGLVYDERLFSKIQHVEIKIHRRIERFHPPVFFFVFGDENGTATTIIIMNRKDVCSHSFLGSAPDIMIFPWHTVTCLDEPSRTIFYGIFRYEEIFPSTENTDFILTFTEFEYIRKNFETSKKEILFLEPIIFEEEKHLFDLLKEILEMT